MVVLNEIIEAKNILMSKTKSDPINKYVYPKLNTHYKIERLKEEERQRQLEQERKEQDKIRYEKEREAFKLEDINIYKEENQEEQTNSELSDY